MALKKYTGITRKFITLYENGRIYLNGNVISAEERKGSRVDIFTDPKSNQVGISITECGHYSAGNSYVNTGVGILDQMSKGRYVFSSNKGGVMVFVKEDYQ